VFSSSRVSLILPSWRSSTTDLSHTRSVLTLSRALASRIRARSYSLFSLSSLTAANQIDSELMDLKASLRMPRAPSTSPYRASSGQSENYREVR